MIILMNMKEFTGLTHQQVQEKIAQGLTNNFTANTSTSTWQIIKRNVFTLFNALNFAIALALVAVQAWSNLVFFAVICFNALSGIVTELRAKHMVDKLNLLNKEKITVIRDGKSSQINPEDLVLDDCIQLATGEQIPSDATVLDGFAEVNEAMLTGESDLVQKEIGEQLLSGSFLASGRVIAKITHVGSDNYASKLMLEAKTVKPINSRIMKSMDRIAGFTGKIIIPFGIALFLEALLVKHLPVKDSVVNTSTALLGMLPKGIALLTITSLLTAVIKLGLRKVLVQEMYSVETLARVDMLCLDKTGTITQGKMHVETVSPLTEDFSEQAISDILSAYITASDDNNPTAQAIRKQFTTPTDYQTSNMIPFSSDRKWGAMEMSDLGTVFLGAPEMLFHEEIELAQEAQKRGSRVLALAISPERIGHKHIHLPSSIQPIAILEITDPIRDGATDTLEYLRSQEVGLKIISGDNPITVSNIAAKAGFANYQSYVDCSKVTDQELIELTEKTAIFGRVSPHQKKLIIQTLKKAGHTTAMTGDGVNDILALREADCSIAMAEGDPATRQVANLVLLNSDFNDVPEILFEGRRVVNNIARIAPIFLIKTTYSFILTIICISSILLGRAEWILVFPFIPIQITLIDQFVEGLPPFVLTFERNIKPVEQDFLKKAIFKALPSGLMVVFSVLFVNIFGGLHGWSQVEISTLLYYLLGSIGFLSVVRACLPLNLWRILLILWSLVGFFGTAILLQKYIEIATLTSNSFPIYIILMILFTITFIVVTHIQNKREQSL
ncbi:ATPase [Streptococcus sp. HMSC071H03]|uniref:Cation-translocating P-type ATPase n=2 Tax=Streptococcus anginosus TaxID=1328 RepID=A0AAP6BND5_STRAP|nr:MULTISPECIES: cation-translocating P-type ATPase [Streptococcus]ALL03397.1 Cadmium-transporting ATPase [Streptococcus anginosus]MDU6599827.1 cation-translocating P-type ATPase [Streptococcus anginosus]MDX5040017.1 cation-translocating P-type ATPase [Streptococcus anginosus]OFR43816.1 ATPase [Streptococcus sp. HMSC071H03]